MVPARTGWTTPSLSTSWTRAWRPAWQTWGPKWHGASHGKGTSARPALRPSGAPGRRVEAFARRPARGRQGERRVRALLRRVRQRAALAGAHRDGLDKAPTSE